MAIVYSPWGCKEHDTTEQTHTYMQACAHTHTHTQGQKHSRGKQRVRTLENKLQSPVYAISYGIRGKSVHLWDLIHLLTS